MRVEPSSRVIQRLVDSHRQFLAFLEKRVESRAVAEDILQSAFVKGLERGSELRDEESAVAWFYRVLRNATIDHYRRRGANQKFVEGFAKEFAQNEVADPKARNEICGCIVDLMDTLKPEYGEALRMIEIDGGTLQDLAARTGITSNNAAVRVHRAREALRKQVVQACGTCAEHGCLDCQCESAGSSHSCEPPG